MQTRYSEVVLANSRAGSPRRGIFVNSGCCPRKNQRFCLWGRSGRGRCGNYATAHLVYQNFLAATLIAALHCISSCHHQLSIASLWNDCSWLQIGRQCNHSICTLQLSTTTHAAAQNDPHNALQTALREVAEILRKLLRKISRKSSLLRQ